MIINIRFIAMFVAQTAGAVVRGQRIQGTERAATPLFFFFITVEPRVE